MSHMECYGVELKYEDKA
ncbi:Protein of unknown function [Lactobacillus delbrueckii subsp. lactis]|nr:Protein of unknown function [Lactobacillus delbrueckii subsp. lactis]